VSTIPSLSLFFIFIRDLLPSLPLSTKLKTKCRAVMRRQIPSK
jgi:hypothetical protein